MASEVAKDLKNAKENRDASVRLVDGKISARFEKSTNEDYVSVPKIFENWEEFVDYAKAFFK